MKRLYKKKSLFTIIPKIIAFLNKKLGFLFVGLVLVYPPFISTNLNIHDYSEQKNTIQNQEISTTTIYPIIEKKAPRKVMDIRITAYSSTIGQTDSTPFITANGTCVHDGIIAANCFPFGTKVRIPDLFGDKIFTVQDRMAVRMGCSTIDIWFADTWSARQFGKKYSKIEVL